MADRQRREAGTRVDRREWGRERVGATLDIAWLAAPARELDRSGHSDRDRRSRDAGLVDRGVSTHTDGFARVSIRGLTARGCEFHPVKSVYGAVARRPFVGLHRREAR